MSKINDMNRKGFTIVELLIVIVVIGILAAVTIVAYSGIARNARNTSRVSLAGQTQKLVQTALTFNASSAIKTSMNQEDVGYYNACIGNGHKDTNADGIGDCGIYNGSVYAKESAAFNTLLTSVASIPSMANYPQTTATDGDVVTGPFLETLTVDSVARFAIEYSLEGTNQKCGTSPLAYGGSPWTLTKPGGSAADYSVTGSGVTGCVLVVGDQ